MRGGIVYILQEFVFHVHCFCCPLYDFFCFVLGGGYSTVTILITGFKRLFFLISVSHSRFALLKMFSNEFFGQYLGKSRDFVLVFTFAVCDSSFQLQDTVLVVSDLRQRVISRDQSDRSPIWPYQSGYICFLSIGKNFKYQI